MPERRILACPRCRRVGFFVVGVRDERVRCPSCYHWHDAAATVPEGEHVERQCIGCLRERTMATATGWGVCTTCGCSRPLGLLIGDPEAGGVYWAQRRRDAEAGKRRVRV